ncbi:MAG: PIG-L family deacetylase [Chitinophagaceae bacterium]|nr:PIG-L family deacetylase [Chitinophagaceae bacterium]
MIQHQVDLLAFGAHPDDVECATAGTLLRHMAMSKKAAIVDITAGEMGRYGRPLNAAYAEGFTSIRFVGVPDLFQLI